MNNANQKLEDITPKKLFEYYESRRLGHLTVPLSDGYASSYYYLDLAALCTGGMNVSDFEQQTAQENVEVICAFGSALHKNFPRKEKIRRKRLFFFGSWIEKEFSRPRKNPDDFDALFILKEGLTNDKIILPEYNSFGYKSWKKSERTERKVSPDIGSEEGLYGPYDMVYSSPFGKLPNIREDNTYSVSDAKPLHITHRSIKQFLRGICNGDDISKSVVEYGIPLFGRERFYEIIKDIKTPKREALHNVVWREYLNGRLEGTIT